MAKIHVTLALMVLSRLFGLPELVRARASSGKLKKVFCKFTDGCLADESRFGNPGNEMLCKVKLRRCGADPSKNESGMATLVR
jgi:hypothetical protein